MSIQRHEFRVLRVVNISTHEAVDVGRVQAWDHDDARIQACERDLIHDYETFRVERVDVEPAEIAYLRNA